MQKYKISPHNSIEHTTVFPTSPPQRGPRAPHPCSCAKTPAAHPLLSQLQSPHLSHLQVVATVGKCGPVHARHCRLAHVGCPSPLRPPLPTLRLAQGGGCRGLGGGGTSPFLVLSASLQRCFNPRGPAGWCVAPLWTPPTPAVPPAPRVLLCWSLCLPPLFPDGRSAAPSSSSLLQVAVLDRTQGSPHAGSLCPRARPLPGTDQGSKAAVLSWLCLPSSQLCCHLCIPASWLPLSPGRAARQPLLSFRLVAVCLLGGQTSGLHSLHRALGAPGLAE